MEGVVMLEFEAVSEVLVSPPMDGATEPSLTSFGETTELRGVAMPSDDLVCRLSLERDLPRRRVVDVPDSWTS